eukprot:scaffold283728_cov18-Tisochrysis_lutea.AAC.1
MNSVGMLIWGIGCKTVHVSTARGRSLASTGRTPGVSWLLIAAIRLMDSRIWTHCIALEGCLQETSALH